MERSSSFDQAKALKCSAREISTEENTLEITLMVEDTISGTAKRSILDSFTMVLAKARDTGFVVAVKYTRESITMIRSTDMGSTSGQMEISTKDSFARI
jgi:hypothetical protein